MPLMEFPLLVNAQKPNALLKKEAFPELNWAPETHKYFKEGLYSEISQQAQKFKRDYQKPAFRWTRLWRHAAPKHTPPSLHKK
jgi:hypothetical protein